MNSFYPTLKRLCMFMALLLVVISTNGQSVSNYLFSTNNVSSLNRTAGSLIDDIDMNTGTTIHVGGSQNNSTSATQPIGFDFFVNGTRQTTFNVTSNGWVSIGGFASAFYGFLNVAAGVRVTPFLGTSGATGSMGTSSIGRVHSKVVGSQPNRVLVVEFLRMAIPANTTNDTNTFQVRLYEATGSIEFVYGKMKVNSGAPLSFNTGFQFSSSLYQHVNINTHTASTSSSTPNNIATNGSIASLDNENLGSQRSYMWIPDPVSDAGAITVSNVTTTSMRLTWNDVANEIGYVLYRSTDGGLTYTYQFNLGANVNIVNISALIANTTYHWRVYALRESISAPADGSGATLPATKFYTIASGNWSDPNIWNTLAVPSAQDSAEISVSHNVVLDLASIACGALIVKGNLSYWSSSTYQVLTTNGDVIVENGGVFTAGTASYTTGTPFRLNIGGNLSTIDVPGSLIVNGTLDLATANTAVEVRFNGINSGTISGSGAICELPFIYVDKSLVANTIEVLRTYTQPQSNTWFTFTQRLQVQTGTFKISAPVVTNSFSTTTLLFASNTNGRLWLNHPSINLGMHPSSINGQMQLQGELRIDDGTLSVGTGSQSQFVTINGAIRMNGGQLNIFGSLQILNTAAATLIVNSGRIVIDPQAATSLNTFTNAFVVNALASFSFSGGSIEIVDPHAAAGGTSISVQSGGSKSITGGSFIIGNDLATTTGGTLSTTSGFSINCAYPIYKLIVKNNISSFPSRTLRLLNGLTIIDSLIINTNGYLQTTSAGTGYNLQVLGHVLNNGTISGTTPTFTGQGFGQVNFEGTTLQRVSGAGNATSLKMRIANPAGVNFTNTSAWLLDLVILEKGNVTNTAGALTIGGPTYRGDVTIGGLDETTTAGSFSTIPAINTTFDLVNYTYGPAANSLQTGSFNEMSAGSANIGTLTINDAQGVTANRNISLQDGLNLTTGLLKMGNNSLTLGTSATSGGVLTRVDGFVQLGASGSFTRWFTTGSFFSYNYTLGFPLSNGLSERSVLLSLNGANFTTGGNLTVRHNNISSYTDISPTFTDGTTTINRRSNSYWLISSSSAPGLTGRTLKVRLIGAGIGAISNVAELRIVKSNSAFGGTTQAGSGTVTAPEINRDFSQANLSAGIVYDTMYVGTNLGINPLSPTIIAINTGNWNDPATWEDNVIPSISNSAIIATGVNVTIPAAYTALCNGLSISAGATLTASAGSMNNGGSISIDGTMIVSGSTLNVVSTATNGLTINTGGTLTVNSGTLNIGPSGGSNRTLTNDGTLNVTGGTLTINGNMIINSGSTFNQSGGDVNIDANSSLAATSTTQGTHLLTILSNQLNCNAGNINFIDPPHSSISTATTNTLRVQVAAGSLTAFTGSHTIKFGNGTSTESGNTNGFSINTRATTGIIPLQNITVDAGSGTGRWVSTSYTSGTGTHIKGNITINTGGEFRHVSTAPFAVGGNIINNGTLTVANPVIFGGSGYVINNTQAISGTGVFRNALVSPTGAFTNLTLDNGTGLTLNTSNYTFGVSGILNLGALKITTNNNTIGITSSGSISRTSGYIVGNLAKNIAAGINIIRTYEIGTPTNYLPVNVTYPSVTTAGDISLGINLGDHPQLATSCINPLKSVNLNWKLTNIGALTTGGNYTFNYSAGDVDGAANMALAKLFVYDGSSWKSGITGTSTPTSFAVTGLNIYGDVAMGEITPVPTSVTISTADTNVCAGTSVTFTASIINGGDNPTYQWKINGVNSVTTATLVSSTLANNDVVTCEIVSNSPCVTSPNAVSNSKTMIVNPATVGGTVTGGATVCSGNNSGLLTLSANTGSVVKWQSSSNAAFTGATDIVNTALTYTSGVLTATTYFRAVVKSGACAAENSSSTIVTITPPSVSGTISGNNAVCSGASAGNLTLAGFTGSIVKWQSAVSPFSVWADIANTAATQSAGSPTQTIHYRAVVKSGTCPDSTSAPFIITVTPSSVGGSVSSSQSICSGGTVAALNLTGNTGNVTKWQSANNATFTGATDIANTTTTLTPTGVTSTTYYRALVQSGSCPVANSASVTITVSPSPVGGSVTGTSPVCSGTSPGNLTLSGHTGTISKWQSRTGSSWLDISNTTTTHNPGVLVTTTQFRAVLTSGSCVADTSTIFTVTVTPVSVGGSVSSSQSICSGGTVAAINLTGQTGNVTKWQSANNATFTGATDIANTTTTLTPTGVTSTTYYRAVVQSGSCAVANSASVTITVSPAPVGGSVTGTSSVCSGSSPGNLTLSGHTGTISKWQSNTGSSWVDIANTTTTLNPGTLTTTTQYRAVLTSGSCVADTSAALTVTVSPASVGGSVSSSQSICSGGTVAALNLTGQTGNVTKWQSANNATFTGATDIANTTTTLTPTGVTSTTYYRAVVQSGSCTAANSASVTITVSPAPVGGSVTGTSSVCSGSSPGNLTLSGHTGTISKWQSNTGSSWVDIANTTTTLNPGTLTTTTQYRAVLTSGSCVADTSAALTVTVSPASVGGSVSSSQSICSGGTVAALNLTGQTGNVTKWQSANNATFTGATDIANTTTTLTPTGVTSTTYYRAVVQSGSCAVANSASVTITVSPAPVGGSVTGTSSVCSGSSPGNLTLSGHTGTISKWQSNTGSSWVDIANPTTTLNPGTLTTTTQYRAVLTSGSCVADTSAALTVTVSPASVGGSVSSSQSICSGGTVAALNLTGQTGNVTKWQSANNATFTGATDIANTTTTLTPTGVTSTTYYRAVVQSGSCTAANSASVTITISPSPVGGTITGTNAVCSGNSPGTLTLGGHTGNISNWQSKTASSWTDISNTTASYNPGNLSITTQYRAVLTSGSCAADTSAVFTVTVTPSSVGGSISSNQTICANNPVTQLTLSGHVGFVTRWQSANNATFTGAADISGTTGSTTYTPTGVTSTTYYRAVIQSGACTAVNSSAATITVNPSPIGGAVTGTSSVCSATSPGALTLSGHTGTITLWQSNSGSGWINISNTTASYNPGNLTTTTQFRAVLSSGSCVADTSTAHTVSVTTASVGGTVSSNQSICSGGIVAALNLTGNTGTVTKWQSANNATFTGATDINNTTTTYTPTGVTSDTYYRAVVTNGACASANSSSVLITVGTPSAGGSVSGNQTICAGDAVTQLSLTGNTGAVTKWQSSSSAAFTTPVDIANTTTTYTPTGVTTTTYYRAVITNGGCPSANSTSALITVNPASVGGVIAGSTPICTNGTTNLFLSGQVGTIIKWQSAVSPFSTYSDIANTTSLLSSSGITQNTRFRAVIQNGSCATVNSNEFEVAVTNSGIWTGATSSSWNVATNWCGGVPTATTDVVIPSGTPNGPSIDITTAVARNITVDAGATLNFTGTTNIIDIKGNLVVNGTFNTVNGTVSLSGAVAQSFAGITYDNLVINSNTVKTLTGDANVANSLTLTLGIVNLNGFVLRTFSLTNITGGGSSSYFVTGTGGLKQFVGATPKLFHLGSSTSYNPVTINNTGTTGNFTVTMLDDIYNSYTGLVGSSPIATNVLRRTLNIEKDFVGAVSADITVQWNAVDESSLNRTQLIVGWFNGGVWSNTGAAVTAATGSNPYLHTFSITQTGLYGIGDVNSPLPVSLVSFGAKLVKGISLVSWTTASEINLKNFDVERSFDGHNFSKIGEVNAKGNSSSRLDYRFVDETSPEALAATNVLYYRLKQQDISGHFEYSKIVSVSHFNAIVFDVIATTPNPFNDEAEISYKTSSNSIVQVQVTDAFGKLIKTATLSPEIGANVYKLELDDLNASGVYFVKITQDGKSKIVKAIKK